MILVALMNLPHAVLTLPPTDGPPVVVLHSVNFLSTDPSAVEEVTANLNLSRCDHEPKKIDTDSVYQKL